MKLSNKELLEDVTFDREIAPKDAIRDILVDLLKKKAFDKKSSILLSEYSLKEGQFDQLIKNNRIKLILNGPIKYYLTEIGRIVAYGEFTLRQREVLINGA